MTNAPYPISALRYPPEIEYFDPGNSACDPITTAYLLWRIGASEDLWQPNAVAEISGQLDGELSEPARGYRNTLLLLENEADIVNIDPFDRKRLVAEGLDYMADFHADGWLKDDPTGFQNYWQDNLEEFVDASKEFDLRTQRDFSSTYRSEVRKPSIEDLQTLQRGGRDIKCMVKSNLGPGIVHTVVAVNFAEIKGFKVTDVFNPNLAASCEVEGPILSMVGEWFEDEWIAAEGILAVRKH